MHALPWRPSQTDGLGRGVGLALLAHAMLLVALKFGLDWRTQTQEPAFEAELWATVPRAAAPPLETPPPPDPTHTPAPTPPAPDEAALQAQREADIRLDKERERQARERAEQTRLETARREREAKAREERLQAEKIKREKAQQEKARAEQEKIEQARDAKRQQERADAQREKLRQEQLRRIQGMAGGTGGPQATGNAEVSAGPSASYAGRVMARVRPNIRPPKDFPRELVTDVLVRCASDGTILSATIRRSSGNAEWDEWALRAVLATATLPRDTNGTVPKEMVIGIRPNE
ncbi:MAG: cell envelope integrity protein TolA [Inhella sp.]|uniref:cell envelope integrity protein TolA n=1 Tax=Inhella sp. TaxID=1921806 RepID=UPI00391C96ED